MKVMLGRNNSRDALMTNTEIGKIDDSNYTYVNGKISC